jgi:hypothetical protein
MPHAQDLLRLSLLCFMLVAVSPVFGQTSVATSRSRTPSRPSSPRGSRGTSPRLRGDVEYIFDDLDLDRDVLSGSSIWQVAHVDIPFPTVDSLEDVVDAPPKFLAPGIVKFDEVLCDYGHFYSTYSLFDLAIVTAVGATLANTDFDESIRDFFDDNVSGIKNDEWRESVNFTKELGNGMYSLPAFLLTASLPILTGNDERWSLAAQWGNHGLRTFVVGAPVVYIGQQVTGGSRPGETDHGSAWRPWQDNNGVSGHAFMGALPFLAAVDLIDNPWYQGVVLAASTLPGISRITDDDHYASQVLLGWTCAYLASRAVSRTNRDFYGVTVAPWTHDSAAGLGLSFQW